MAGTRPVAHRRDTLDPANDHGACKTSENEARQPGWNRVVGVHHIGDGLGLDAGACAPAGQNTKGRESAAEPDPLRSHAVFDVVHGPADMTTVGVDFAKLYRQDAFAVLRSHAKEGRHPHPEDRTRPTNGDGRCYAGDVAGPDGRGQRRHQRAERRDIPFAGAAAFAEKLPERVGNTVEGHPT